jgi:hypothetical protein
VSEQDYRKALGDEAASRQREEARLRHSCCGELKTDGHHPLCRNYVEKALPDHIDGQESLL